MFGSRQANAEFFGPADRFCMYEKDGQIVVQDAEARGCGWFPQVVVVADDRDEARRRALELVDDEDDDYDDDWDW